jgi:NAD(P)-dependent dehydrogenase (short-subunit alcohol dehydrogenase family)
MSIPVAIILGSGANLGHHVAGRFRSEGYRVATVSRSKSTENDDETSLSLTCDLADPREVETVFATVRKAWGEPSVVVYNGMVSHPSPTASKQPPSSFSSSTPTTNTSQHSLLPNQRPNPGVRLRPLDARLRAPPHRQYDVCFRCGARGFERFQTVGSWEFLLHWQFPPLELAPETHDAGSW